MAVASERAGEVTKQQPRFGEGVPWGDPISYSGIPSPYYKPTHHEWRAKVRKFVDTEIMPYCHEWDEAKMMPKELHRKAGLAGILPGCCAGVPEGWPTKYVGKGPPEWDNMHVLIMVDELARCGSGGVCWGLFGGLGIGLPPVLHFGSEEMNDRISGPCLRGEKFICLAITEPYAGSDVANIRCTAERDATGEYFIVNGEKKWITNGIFADYFTVAVRTGGAGMGGISLLLIERDMPGITTTQMNCMGVWPSGTSYITFDNVKVPVSNLIGVENMGFMVCSSPACPESTPLRREPLRSVVLVSVHHVQFQL